MDKEKPEEYLRKHPLTLELKTVVLSAEINVPLLISRFFRQRQPIAHAGVGVGVLHDVADDSN